MPMPTNQPPDLDLSIVIPIYNEEENITPLVEDVLREVSALEMSFEVILVNDGSSDGSAERLDAAAEAHPEVRVIHFACNCGQTLALAAGMHEAGGRTIVCLDGDRQNDPSDIGRLIEKLEEGYACVSGWRKDRQDAGLRRFVSRVANSLVQRITGVPVHDLGCTLKAYRRDALDPRELFGEMHRFLAVYAMAGGKVAEMVVKHHPRRAGISKYGLSRTARVVADLLLIRVLFKYRTRPSHIFANMAQYMVAGGGILFVLSVLLELVFRWSLWRIGFISAVVAVVGACVLLAVGVCCELVMRNRYLLGDRLQWLIARRVNFEQKEL
ncbi:MAG: glycosyltransferase family 2 protein [Phycisphaerae bacterium]|nr:glycosyltransferase family 2 protein [Phycisphaerae bacterium]